jgi:uncharacterized membrane-anchored protein
MKKTLKGVVLFIHQIEILQFEKGRFSMNGFIIAAIIFMVLAMGGGAAFYFFYFKKRN